jgi:hypothetical protein
MLLPAMGILLGIVGFGLIGTIALWLSSGRRPRLRALFVVVISACAIAAAWGFAFGKIFGGSHGQLESTVQVVAHSLDCFSSEASEVSSQHVPSTSATPNSALPLGDP